MLSETKAITSEMLAKLMAPLPAGAVERSKGSQTGKGYNTTGYGYQWVADRMNEVLGVGSWNLIYNATAQEWGQTSTGKPMFRADVRGALRLGYWEGGKFITLARGPFVGGHVSLDPIDAEKGAITNAFKKAAALLCGVGSDAYRGQIDDDNEPVMAKAGAGEQRPQHEAGSMWAALEIMQRNINKILANKLCVSEKEEQFLLQTLERFDRYGDDTRLSEKQQAWIEEIWAKFQPFMDGGQGAARAAEEPKGMSVTPNLKEPAYLSDNPPEDDLPF